MKSVFDYFRILGKVILVGIPLIGIWLYSTFGKMYFIDGEAAYYLWMADQIHTSHEDVQVLVLGDSAMNSAIDPSQLPVGALSLANGGGCPYEAYYILKEYLEHNEAPCVVYIGYNFQHMEGTGALWERTFYNHLIDYQDAAQLLDTMETMNFSWAWDGHDSYQRELLAYYVNYPGVYLPAIINAGVKGRYQTNKDAQAFITEHQGRYIGVSDMVNQKSYSEVECKKYCVAPICDVYIRQLMDLCQEHGIMVRWVTLPMCPEIDVPDSFREAEQQYMEELVGAYEGATYFPVVEDMDHGMFFDDFHMNNPGCAYYMDCLMKAYPEDFE